jgi:hypothetical protein
MHKYVFSYLILSPLNHYRIAFCLQAGVTQSEMRTAILKAIKLYLSDRATAAKSMDRRLHTPGTEGMPVPSAPPCREGMPVPSAPPCADGIPIPSAPYAEEMEECGSVQNFPVAECVVCMEGRVSIAHGAEN